MNKKISLGATISLVAIAAAITLIITMSFTLESFNGKISGIKELEENYKKLAEIDSRVRTNFNGTIDEDAIQDAIAQGYMAGLNDKYARYYSAEDISLNVLLVRVNLSESASLSAKRKADISRLHRLMIIHQHLRQDLKLMILSLKSMVKMSSN